MAGGAGGWWKLILQLFDISFCCHNNNNSNNNITSTGVINMVDQIYKIYCRDGIAKSHHRDFAQRRGGGKGIKENSVPLY